MRQMKRVEFDYYIAPDGTEYRFHDNDDRFLMSFSDMGMPPISYIKQKGPFQHGSSLLDYRLEERIIQYIHRRDGCSREEYWDNRADIINALRPNRQSANTFALGKLRKKLPDKSVRDIDVLILEGPTFGPRSLEDWDEFGFTEALRFIAPDPTFYDPTVYTAQWTLDPNQTDLVFPFEFPFELGYTVISGSNVVNYAGTWLSYPTIEVRGPISSFTIINAATSEKISLNYEIKIGETVTISLEFGNKTVVNNVGTNLIGVVTTDSDLSTFHIAPDPEASGGVNTFNVTGASAKPTTRVTLTYYVRYIGI